MAGPELATQMGAQCGRLDEGQLPSRVQVRFRGSKDKIGAAVIAHLQVVFHSARIRVQILPAVELERIYENASHHDIVLATRGLEERYMTGMQRSHGWNKSDRLVTLENSLQALAELAGLTNDLRHCRLCAPTAQGTRPNAPRRKIS